MRYIIFFIMILTLNIATTNATLYPFPQEKVYHYGRIPPKFLSQEVQEKYEYFLDQYYEENTSGDQARIKFVDPANGDAEGNYTVSEGIGYGMLIMVYMDNDQNQTKEKFDKLWAYYKAWLDGNGLMNWKIYRFDYVAGSGAATDADLDVALALLQAYKQWDDITYLNDAKNLIAAIRNNEIDGGTYLLEPGDQWSAPKNPSYESLVAFMLFKQVDTGYETFWDNVINANINFLKNSQNSTTGLFPDWANDDGSPNSKGADFKYDAVRTPWRIAWYYLWYGDPQAKTMDKTITNWIMDKTDLNPGAIVDGYSLDGNEIGKYNNATFVGAFATASMVDSSFAEWSDIIYNNLALMYPSKDAYFGNTLKVLYMLLLTGNMPNFWDLPPQNPLTVIEPYSVTPKDTIDFNVDTLKIRVKFNRRIYYTLKIKGLKSGTIIDLTPEKLYNFQDSVYVNFVNTSLDYYKFQDNENIVVEFVYNNIGVWDTISDTIYLKSIMNLTKEEFLIDDFEDGDSISNLSTKWYKIGNGVEYNIVNDPEKGDVLKIGISTTNKVIVGVPFVSENVGVDINGFNYIVYYYKGPQHFLRVRSLLTEGDEPVSKLDYGSNTWKQVIVRQWDLTQPYTAQNPVVVSDALSKAIGLEWSVEGYSQNLYIDDIYLIPFSKDSIVNRISDSTQTFVQNYNINKEFATIAPNPFNPITILYYNNVNNHKNYELHIYNIEGKIVLQKRNLLKNGINKIIINGEKWPSGIYFIRFKSGNFYKREKLLLIK